jgi:phospholipid/cholesterol/gamma-HCH transport system substrate-binding protein
MSRRAGRGGGHGPSRGALVRFTAFAVVTGLLTLFIAAQITGTSFGDRYRLVGTFDDVTGLLEGDLVKVAGTPVGRVTGIGVTDGRAEVTVAVDDGVRLPRDSTMSIRWRNMIGQRMVYLEPGRSTAMLEPGDRVTRTRSVVDLGELVNGLGPLTRNLDPGQLNQLLNAFAKALDGNTGDINVLITDLDGLTRTFAARSQAISQMTKDYSTVSGAIARRDRQIAQSVDNLAELTEFFAGNTRILDEAVVEISGVTTNLNAVLGGNEERLGRTIRSLSRFTGTARVNIDKLEQVVRQLPPAMRALFQTFNGGHFMRTTALCLGVVQGPCPFPMTLPGQPANANPAPGDLKKLEALLRGGR